MKTYLKELINSIGKQRTISFSFIFLILYAIQGLQPHFISILISDSSLYIGILGISASLLTPRIIQFFSNSIVQDIRSNSKNVLIKRLFNRRYLYFKENDVGTTIHLIDEISFASRAIFNDAILPLLADLVFLIISFAILSKQNTLIGILFLLLFLFYSFTSCLFLRKNGGKITAVIDTSATLKSMLIDIYSNIASIFVHKTQLFEISRLEEKTKEERTSYYKLQDKINKTNLVLNTILIAFICIIFISISRSIDDSKSFEVLLILIYSILNLSGIGNTILTFIEYKDRLKTAINKSTLYCDDNESIGFDLSTQYAITLDSVSYGYESILKNSVSFLINEKEKIIIIGENGSGKSTLLKLLAGLIKPLSGTISYKDDINPSIDIGYYAQDGILFNRSIKENIIYPYTNDYDKSEIWEIIRKVGLEHIIKNNADLDNPAGDEGNLFSGGEKQKILIARALYEKKRIVLFDEITSSLDKESCMMFQQILFDDFQNSTVLLVSHTLANMPNTRIIDLDKYD